MEGLGTDDYSYCPMNFRLWPETVLPRYFSTKSSSLLIAIDISGSVRDDVLRKLVSVAAPAVNRASRVEVCTFDSKMRESKIITSPSQILSLSYKSGPHSHTSAMEVFEKARREKYRIVLVSTDMHIEYPKKPRPGVIWATPEGSPTAKWGKQFYIKEFW
jgi:predicted metal-dependent peptidase